MVVCLLCKGLLNWPLLDEWSCRVVFQFRQKYPVTRSVVEGMYWLHRYNLWEREAKLQIHLISNNILTTYAKKSRKPKLPEMQQIKRIGPRLFSARGHRRNVCRLSTKRNLCLRTLRRTIWQKKNCHHCWKSNKVFQRVLLRNPPPLIEVTAKGMVLNDSYYKASSVVAQLKNKLGRS